MKKNGNFGDRLKRMIEEQKKLENERTIKLSIQDNMNNRKNIGSINKNEYLKKMKDEQNKLIDEKKSKIKNNDDMQNNNKNNMGIINKNDHLQKMKDEQNRLFDTKKNNIEINDEMGNSNKNKISKLNKEQHLQKMNEEQNRLMNEKKNTISNNDVMQNLNKNNIGSINQEEHLQKMNDEQNKLMNEKKSNIEINDDMQNSNKDNIGSINQEEHLQKMNDEQNKLINEKKSNIEINDDMQNLDEINNDIERKEKFNNMINDINQNIELDKLSSIPKEKEEQKLEDILGIDTILESKEKFTIYKYPDFQFTSEDNNNCKVILMIGNVQNYFIDTFITMYSNIQYEDNFRYSIGSIDIGNISIYNIKSRTKEKNYDIKIVSLPQIEQLNDAFKTNMIELFKEKIPNNSIHIICFAFEENKEELNAYEKIFYKLLIYLLDFKAKILFLILPNQTKDDINNNKTDLIDYFFDFEKNQKDKIDFDYISFNNKTIFECDENDWNKIKEKSDIIKNEIVNSKRVMYTKEKISLMNFALFEEKEKISQKFINLQINEKFIILYYLMDLNFYLKEDISLLILNLFNGIIKNEYDNIFHINDNKLEFIKDQNYGKYIYILSKLSLNFKNLEYIRIMNCQSEDTSIDNTMILFEKITTNKIKNLNLITNNCYDLTWLNRLNIFSNIENLNLSFNKIVNLTPLTNYNFNYLENLNLYHNNIANIGCFKKNHFPALKYLNLSENEINSGIDKFCLAFENTSKDVILDFKYHQNHSEIYFIYSNNLEIEFKYLIEDKNFNNILKNISFEGINNLILKGFDNNIRFLENNTLQSLKTLHIIDNDINDLSIFNNIKFIKLKNIYTNRESNIIKETNCFHIKEGFKYLNYFSLIYAEEIHIEYNYNKKCYNCRIYFNNPKINIFFTNIDFLLDEVLINAKKIYISGNLFNIDGYSSELFSYQTLKAYKLPFLRKIYSDKISIDYITSKNIYECKINFLNPYLNINVNFNDLSFINDSNILNNTKEMILNHIPNNEIIKIKFENFDSSLNLILKNLYIENIEIISSIYPRKFRTFNVECSLNIIEEIENYDFKKIINNNRIKYFYPNLLKNNSDFPEMYENIILKKKEYFCFEIKINREILSRINHLKNCLEINLQNTHINENDLSFLNNDSFSTIIYLNLANNKIKNINFVTYNSLSNLTKLDLSNNEIEDINLLNDENNKCKNLTLLTIKENPIRKGIEVIKQKLFKQDCLYITVNNISKINNEFLISLKFNKNLHYIDLKIEKDDIKALLDYNPKKEDKNKEKNEDKSKFIYLDFYIKDLNDIWNFIEYKDTFFDMGLTFEILKNEFNFNITEEEFLLKKKIYYYLLNLFIYKRNFIYSLDLGSEDNEIIKYFFKYHYDKGYIYLIELLEIDLYLCFEKVKFYFSFLNSNSLNNYNFKGLSNLKEIDLSDVKLNDIKGICGDVPFINVKTLKLSNNPNIFNLYELKNAKFIGLENLDLSHDDINDLKSIGMEEYPFLDLISLNLGYNYIKKIEPVLHFEKLQKLNLEYNYIEVRSALILLEFLPSCRGAELRGNKN